MTEMTVLHIASPFAFAAPVTESRPTDANKDNGDGQQPDTGTGEAIAGQTRAAPRDTGIIDARDARLTLSRTVDLASPSSDIAATAGSLEAVLAAYGEAASLMSDSEDTAD